MHSLHILMNLFCFFLFSLKPWREIITNKKLMMYSSGIKVFFLRVWQRNEWLQVVNKELGDLINTKSSSALLLINKSDFHCFTVFFQFSCYIVFSTIALKTWLHKDCYHCLVYFQHILKQLSVVDAAQDFSKDAEVKVMTDNQNVKMSAMHF